MSRTHPRGVPSLGVGELLGPLLVGLQEEIDAAAPPIDADRSRILGERGGDIALHGEDATVFAFEIYVLHHQEALQAGEGVFGAFAGEHDPPGIGGQHPHIADDLALRRQEERVGRLAFRQLGEIGGDLALEPGARIVALQANHHIVENASELHALL